MSNHNELSKSLLVISALSLSFSLIIAVKLGNQTLNFARLKQAIQLKISFFKVNMILTQIKSL